MIFILASLHGTWVVAQDYASSSVLKQGSWLAVKVAGEGVVRINYSDITALGLQVQTRLYGNNAGLLSYYNDGTTPDDSGRLQSGLKRDLMWSLTREITCSSAAEGTHRWLYDGGGNSVF
ncbi:MAG: hypothetical protein R2744_04510 [Bacteroidales bacterium]